MARRADRACVGFGDFCEVRTGARLDINRFAVDWASLRLLAAVDGRPPGALLGAELRVGCWLGWLRFFDASSLAFADRNEPDVAWLLVDLVGRKEDLAAACLATAPFLPFAGDRGASEAFVADFAPPVLAGAPFDGRRLGSFDGLDEACLRCDFVAAVAGLDAVRRIERVREVMVVWKHLTHGEAIYECLGFPRVPVTLGYHRLGNWGTKNQTTVGQC